MMNSDKFTEQSLAIIENAVGAASELGHTYVGSEHLLLSIADDENSGAASILVENGVTYDELFHELVRIVGKGNKFTFWRQRVVFWEWNHGYKNNW